ncbi:CNP1-like family protein [Ottowia thiooxydans]|uniref:CNP1-like family protein n=1 Tax=Ottowia thiooxydans TaxID=219182 RepID=UPI000685275C|nr:CNP1-like family protein [Ottowia thiooxydans]
MKKPRYSLLPSLAAAGAMAATLCLPLPSAAQSADMDRVDWKEDSVPPPLPYSLKGLIEVEMPRASSVKIGIDPSTIVINHTTGIVRYVVVARGPSAVNAMYEGIRCSTGEYRVYARQTQGGEWSPNSSSEWNSMLGQTTYRHPFRLARNGICIGTGTAQTNEDMVRALKSPKGTLYED